MRKANKFIAFLNIGAVFLIGHYITQGMFNQSIAYQKYILQPTIIIEENLLSMTKKGKKQLELNDQYKTWLNENIEFIKTENANNESFKKQLEKLPIFLKNGQSLWDKLSIVSLSYINSDDIKYKTSLATAKGYNNSIEINIYESQPHYVLNIGTSLLEDKNNFSKNILKIFNNDKKIAFDYVTLHELSHFMSFNLLDENNQSELEVRDDILRNFFAQQNLKESDYNQTDKDNIVTQYSEAVADCLALQLMLKKYPHLKKDKKLIHNLAKFRLKDAEITHLSTVSLLRLDKVLKKQNYNIGSIDEMLNLATQSALFTVQYFSDYSYAYDEDKLIPEKRRITVNFNLEGYKEIFIENQLDSLYDEIDNQQSKNKVK